QAVVGGVQGLKQFFYVCSKVRFTLTGLEDKIGALLGLPLEGGLEDLFDPFPAIGSHLICRYNQAFAMLQSRFTVRTEIPRTSPVSSSLRPPKNLSSTIRLSRASFSSSCLRASSNASNWSEGPTATARASPKPSFSHLILIFHFA